jgi:hypothetical protein
MAHRAVRLCAGFLCLVALRAFAQPITIQAGSPTDQYFTGGVGAWAVPLPAPLAFLRYGTSFSYAIPLANGMYNIAVTVVEPNKTAAGQRLFTVIANGQASAPLDVFALAGADNVAYTLPLQALVGAGMLRLQFTASLGNAIVSEIAVTPVVAGLACTPPAAGVTLYAQLPDGSCLPIVPIPVAGSVAQMLTSTQTEGSVLNSQGAPMQLFQSFYVALTPGGGGARQFLQINFVAARL